MLRETRRPVRWQPNLNSDNVKARRTSRRGGQSWEEVTTIVAKTLPPPVSSRSKRAAILSSAGHHFGQDGYDATKWSTIADEVGIGQTALYHYFESKAHCLLSIMRLQLEQSFEMLQEASGRETDPLQAVEASLRQVYAVTPEDILRLRVLHSNLSILSTPRGLAREEAERLSARNLVRSFETAWTDLLKRAMDAHQIPERDPKQMARAVLGLVVSVWSWFNPKGGLSIIEVGDFTTDCCLRLLGDGPSVIGGSPSPLAKSRRKAAG